MDPAITGALIGVGGVLLGVALTAVVEARTRKHVGAEQREQARHARELIAAEHLDDALTRASAALDRDTSRPLAERYQEARDAWQEGWVSYSSRIRQRELLERYEVVGSILAEVVIGERTTGEIGRHVVARAIANARSTLGHFMRGDDLPATAFPTPNELLRLLGEGDGQPNPIAPLTRWLSEHAMPEFHDSGRARQHRQ